MNQNEKKKNGKEQNQNKTGGIIANISFPQL